MSKPGPDIRNFFKAVGVKSTSSTSVKKAAATTSNPVLVLSDDDIEATPSPSPARASSSITTRRSPPKAKATSSAIELPHTSPPKTKKSAAVDSNGFIDSLDEVDDSTFIDTPTKKRPHPGDESSAKSLSPTHEAAHRTPKKPKTAEMTSIDAHKAVSPPKAKRTHAAKKQGGVSWATKLGTPESLIEAGIQLVNAAELSVMYASYGNFMARAAPPMHGMKDVPKGTPGCLESFTFVVTGVLESLERDEAIELVTRLGATYSKTLGKRVTHAVVGKDAGPSKTAQLKERNIPMLSEDGLFSLIRLCSGESISSNAMDIDEPKAESSASTSSFSAPTSSAAAATSTSASASAKSSSLLSAPISTASAPSKTAIIAKKSAPVSLTVTLPSPVRPRVSTMWTDMYAPQTSAELVGNPGNVKKLKSWLETWEANYEQFKNSKDPETGKSTFAFPRAALLMGSPGIGKTCSALIIAKECGYHPVHLNASDQRSQSTLREKVAGLLSNRSIGEFYALGQAKKPAKTVLLMDEIDGMSTGDRGGLAELTLMIKTTKVPIIAMANDKQKVKSLAQSTSVLPVPFSKPSIAQTFSRIIAIARKEGLTSIPDETISKIIESCQGDLRMTLNCLQMIAANPGALARSGGNLPVSPGKNTTALQAQIASSSKDVTLGPFDVVPRIFSTVVGPNGRATVSFDDRLDHYFVDYSIVPLFVHQNYLKTNVITRSNAAGANKLMVMNDLRTVRGAIDSICDADVLGASIFSQQNFGLLPVHGAVSTVRTAAILNSHPSAVEFPALLGKGSKQRKCWGLLGELSSEMYIATGGANARAIGLDYLSLVVASVTEPLIRHAQAGIEPVLKFMEDYGISKDGRDSALEIAELKWDKTQKDTSPAARISAPVKTAFTRAYNQGSHAATFKRKKAKAAGAAAEDDEEEMPGDDANIPEDVEEDDPENDSLVHIAKAKKTSSAKKAAKASSSTPAKLSKAKSTGARSKKGE